MKYHLLMRLFVISLFLVGFLGCAPSQSGSELRMGTPEQQMEASINLGRVLLMQNDIAGALTGLAKAERIDPNNVEVLTYTGLAFYSRRDFDKAIDYYLRAINLDPAKTDIHNNLGLVYMEQGKYDQAISEFENCLRDPTYARPWLPQFNLASVAQAQGKLADAEEMYNKLLALSPQYAPPYYRLGGIYYDRGENEKAIDYLSSAVKLDPSYADAYYLLAQAYEKAGKKDDAAEAYGQVVVLSPNTPRAIEAQRKARQVLGFE
jgi:Tfp pilus assembly protein PilF